MFASRMGQGFVEAFYLSYIVAADGHVFVATAKGTDEVVGVVAGGGRNIRDEFLRRARAQFRFRILTKALVDTVVLRAVVKGLRKAIARVLRRQQVPAPPWQPRRPYGWLQVVAVRAHMRGTGVASGLMERFLAVFQDQGWAEVLLSVSRSNFRALGFYRKHGFVEVHRAEHAFVLRRQMG